jgi:hypothetical protein
MVLDEESLRRELFLALTKVVLSMSKYKESVCAPASTPQRGWSRSTNDIRIFNESVEIMLKHCRIKINPEFE